MIRDARAGMWAETGLFALASVLLAQMGLGIFLFLVPLQVLHARRGERALLAAGAAATAAIAGVRIVTAAIRGAVGPLAGVLVAELSAVVLLVLGLMLVNAFEARPLPGIGMRLRAVPRLLGATIAAALLAVPVALLVRSRPDLGEGVATVFRDAAATMAAVVSQGTRGLQLEGGIDAGALATQLWQIAAEVFPRSVMLYYFVVLTFAWWAGKRSAWQVTGGARRRLSDLVLADVYVWPLIGSLALILADVAFGIGVAGYAGWNLGLIMLFLYGLQGLGIVQFALDRWGVGRGLRFVVWLVLVVLFLSPGANLAVVVGVPGLGVSDIWLRYRTRRRNTDADQGDP